MKSQGSTFILWQPHPHSEGDTKMFADISRKEQPPRLPFASLIHHCHFWRGFLF